LLAILNGYVGNHQLIAQRIHQQANVDELLGEERVVLVIENRFQLGSSGGAIDLIVQRD